MQTSVKPSIGDEEGGGSFPQELCEIKQIKLSAFEPEWYAKDASKIEVRKETSW